MSVSGISGVNSVWGKTQTATGTAKVSGTATVSTASKSWLGDAWDYVSSIWDDSGSAGAAGCDWESPANVPDLPDAGDGGDLHPADTSTETDTDIVQPDTDEHGYPIIDESYFDIDGSGADFKFSPTSVWETDYLYTSGLSAANAFVRIGTDPTVLDPLDEMTEACYDGLINTTAPSAEDIADGIACTPELLYCPSNPQTRLPVYIASVEIKGHQWVGGDIGWAEIVTADPAASQVFIDESTLNEFVADPESFDTSSIATAWMGTMCAPSENDPYPEIEVPAAHQFTIPADFYASDAMYVRVYVRLLVDARAVNGPTDPFYYETRMFVKLGLD